MRCGLFKTSKQIKVHIVCELILYNYTKLFLQRLCWGWGEKKAIYLLLNNPDFHQFVTKLCLTLSLDMAHLPGLSCLALNQNRMCNLHWKLTFLGENVPVMGKGGLFSQIFRFPVQRRSVKPLLLQTFFPKLSILKLSLEGVGKEAAEIRQGRVSRVSRF